MPRSWPRAAVLVALLGAVGVVSIGALGAQAPSPRPAATGTDDAALCAAEAATQAGRYDLGRAVAGYARVDASWQCSSVEAPGGVPIKGGPPPGTAFWSTVYGTCVAEVEQGCPYPIEVQSWPECARNLGSYVLANDPVDDEHGEDIAPASGPADGSSAGSGPAWEPYTIDGYPSLPAVAFEGGTRLEIYAGRSTVVIFADSDKLAARAARALAPVVSRESQGMSPRELQELASGQAPGC